MSNVSYEYLWYNVGFLVVRTRSVCRHACSRIHVPISQNHNTRYNRPIHPWPLRRRDMRDGDPTRCTNRPSRSGPLPSLGRLGRTKPGWLSAKLEKKEEEKGGGAEKRAVSRLDQKMEMRAGRWIDRCTGPHRRLRGPCDMMRYEDTMLTYSFFTTV